MLTVHHLSMAHLDVRDETGDLEKNSQPSSAKMQLRQPRAGISKDPPRYSLLEQNNVELWPRILLLAANENDEHYEKK